MVVSISVSLRRPGAGDGTIVGSAASRADLSGRPGRLGFCLGAVPAQAGGFGPIPASRARLIAAPLSAT